MNTVLHDPRHIDNGLRFHTEGYADQPYVVRAADGAWVLVVTTGPGHEGGAGQHLVSMRSGDQGRTWSAPVDVEPSCAIAASYSVLLCTPYGRIYCFYNYGRRGAQGLVEAGGPPGARADLLGRYVFKFSDDDGRTWSPDRRAIEVREFECDRRNKDAGKVRHFWNVGRPLVHGGAVILPHCKIEKSNKTEGAFLRSANLLSERDPAKIVFETLPDGDIGLRTPPGGGPVAEEHGVNALSDGTLYTLYRTIDGWPVEAYSTDGGRTWTPPTYMRYSPHAGTPMHARRVKHPRAAIFAWRCSNGRFLCWCHNHGGSAAVHQPGEWPYYQGRNPAWLMAGRETRTPDGLRLEWSQPEILVYDDDPYIGMSYPDLIEEDGRFWVTETQKHIGRVHAIDPVLIDGLFAQWDRAALPADAPLLDLPAPGAPMPSAVPMPPLAELTRKNKAEIDGPALRMRTGFTIEISFTLRALAAGQVLLDNRVACGQGFCVRTTERGTIEIALHDGKADSRWECDPGQIEAGRRHHVGIVVDGGPCVVMFVVDGILNDGGEHREYGWGRFHPWLRGMYGAAALALGPCMDGRLHHLRLYPRALRTSEVVAAQHVAARAT